MEEISRIIIIQIRGLLLEIAVFNNFNIYFKEHITAFCEYVYVYIYVCIIHMIKYDNMYAHIIIYILIMTMIKTEIITILTVVISSSSSYIYAITTCI